MPKEQKLMRMVIIQETNESSFYLCILNECKISNNLPSFTVIAMSTQPVLSEVEIWQSHHFNQHLNSFRKSFNKNKITKCCILSTFKLFLLKIINIMKSKKNIIFPKHQEIMERFGENIKLARKRRKLTTVQVSERADIDRTTLYKIEKGNSNVSIGAYFNVLRVLGLQDDFLKLAADDEFGRKLQDLDLL